MSVMKSRRLIRYLDESLPKGMRFEWTDLTYQEILAGNTALLVFPLCVLLVFLVLAAQYESLILPLAIILIVPMCLFSAITGQFGPHSTATFSNRVYNILKLRRLYYLRTGDPNKMTTARPRALKCAPEMR